MIVGKDYGFGLSDRRLPAALRRAPGEVVEGILPWMS